MVAAVVSTEEAVEDTAAVVVGIVNREKASVAIPT